MLLGSHLGFWAWQPPPTGLAATRGAGPVQHLSDWGIHLNTLPRWHLLPMLSGLPGFGQAGWWLGWGEWGPHGRSCGVCGGLRPCRGPPAGAGGLDLPGCLGRAPGWPSLWIQVQGGGRSAAGADPEGWAPVPHSGKDSVQATGLRWAVASLRPSQNHARCPHPAPCCLGLPCCWWPCGCHQGRGKCGPYRREGFFWQLSEGAAVLIALLWGHPPPHFRLTKRLSPGRGWGFGLGRARRRPECMFGEQL